MEELSEGESRWPLGGCRRIGQKRWRPKSWQKKVAAAEIMGKERKKEKERFFEKRRAEILVGERMSVSERKSRKLRRIFEQSTHEI